MAKRKSWKGLLILVLMVLILSIILFYYLSTMPTGSPDDRLQDDIMFAFDYSQRLLL